MQAEGTDRIGGPPPRRRPLLFAVIALGVLAGLGWAVRSLLVSTDTRVPPVAVQTIGGQISVPATPAAAAPSAATSTRVQPPPVDMGAPAIEAPPLPTLEASDPEVRASLSDVLPATAQPALAPTELLRRIAVLAESFGRGKLLRDRLPIPSPTGKMQVIEREDRIFLAPSNFSRYDVLTDTVATLDANALAGWFNRYEPLLQQAWGELGTDGGTVRGALIGGLELILAAPDLEGEIELVQPAVFYKYADPALESLPDAQTLLIRAGPGNRAVLKDRARRLRDALARTP